MPRFQKLLFKGLELVRKVSVNFFYIDALRTARPTFRFLFERPGAGRAVCPHTAAWNSFLYLPTRCGRALDPAFFLS